MYYFQSIFLSFREFLFIKPLIILTIFKTVIFHIKISNINNDKKPGRFDNPSDIFLFLLAVYLCLDTPSQ